ncbi:MAG: hypothetical protein LUF30_03245 [Lachnospiraceae bacterium]|nr:hypothetical protein [Lachnospiraceae bacterium]
MAEQVLRRMKRTELIEIIYALQQNDKMLQQENEELHRQLNDKQIRIDQSGSIAEAALSLNHIFEDAEAAAQQYLESIRNTLSPSGENQKAEVPAQQEEISNRQDEYELCSLKNQQVDAETGSGDTAGEIDKRQESDEDAEQQTSDLMGYDGLQNGRQISLEETQLECERLLSSTQLACDLLRSEAQSDCDRLWNEAQSDCDKLRNEAQSECDRMRSETEAECRRIRRETMQQARDKMDIVEKGINLALDKYPMLKEYLNEELKTGGDSQ